MEPIQVWVPLIGPSIGLPDVARDMRRALVEWDCDHRVWLLPGLPTVIRWHQEREGRQIQLLAVPAERLECIDVYHVGENGFVFGPADFDRFPGWRVGDLLKEWLDWPLNRKIRWAGPWEIDIPVPEIDGEDVAYRNHSITVPVLPVMKGPEGGVTFENKDKALAPVFPDAELSEALKSVHGQLQIGQADGRLVIFGGDGDEKVAWPAAALAADAPLDGLFAGGVSRDALHQWVKMSGVMRDAEKDIRGALHRASAWAAPYLSTGRSTRALTWYLPTLSEVGDIKTVIQRGATLLLNSARSYEEVRSDPEWRRVMTEYIPVRRAWGPVGLFWTLVLDQLQAAEPLRTCKRCGARFPGTSRKQFCGPNDNRDCYRERRAADRRRERADSH